MRNILIRSFQDEDFELICSWWKAWNEVPPLPGMMISDGTFVLEYEDKPVMTLTAFKTQSKEIAYFEGYCRCPKLDTLVSNQLGVILWNHGYKYLKDNGFKRAIALTDKLALRNRYLELGMDWNLSNLYSLGKVL
jgi:hypothetical protein